jgi:hypothetical protein
MDTLICEGGSQDDDDGDDGLSATTPCAGCTTTSTTTKTTVTQTKTTVTTTTSSVTATSTSVTTTTTTPVQNANEYPQGEFQLPTSSCPAGSCGQKACMGDLQFAYLTAPESAPKYFDGAMSPAFQDQFWMFAKEWSKMGCKLSASRLSPHSPSLLALVWCFPRC